MKLFLVKLGKSFEAIRRDGLIVGGKRVLQYFWTFLKAIFNFSSGDVLIITGGVGDSANYRAFNVAEELNLHGLKSSVTIQDNPFLLKYADRFRVFVFHRTLFTAKIQKLIEKIKIQKKEIIFDTDDLVFDAKYMHDSDSYDKMNSLEKKQYEKGVGEEILTDAYTKVCSTSTNYIAGLLEERGKKVFVVPNKLSNRDLKITEEILKSKVHKVKSQKSIRIGYFSGTMSHNRDFATITEALIKVMEKYSEVKLVLAGPLGIENKLNNFKNRIEQLPFAPREKHFENISNVDINLAPLEMGNPYCEAKSELKFFEAGIVGVPTVAVVNKTFSGAIEDGVDGFLAGTTDGWLEKISKLIENKDLRKKMGEKAREKALQKYSNKNSHSEEYYNYLKSRLA